VTNLSAQLGDFLNVGPVRIHIDEMPPDVVLSAGMTATVEIDGRPRARTRRANPPR
jgi:multidrug resistance efflux pump